MILYKYFKKLLGTRYSKVKSVAHILMSSLISIGINVI